MGRLRHILYWLIALSSATIYSCNTSGCLENRSSIPLAKFYAQSGEAISVDSLKITGIGKAGNKPLYEGDSPLQEAYLPLRSTEDKTSWELTCPVVVTIDEDTQIRFTVSDTINFEYKSSPYFASDECGVIFKYQITKLSYTKHLIDSIAVTDSLITNQDIERIKIFFRTSQSQQ